MGNTIEQSMRGGDATFCNVCFTTYFSL